MERKESKVSQEEREQFIALLSYYDLLDPSHIEGGQYKVVCPFHDDLNASLGINIEKCYFYCYAGCGAQGSTLDLYKCFWKLRNPGKKVPSDLQCLLAIKKAIGETAHGKHYNILSSIYNSSSKVSFVDNELELKKEARDHYYNLPTPDWFRPSKVPSIYEETLECKEYMRKRGFSPKALKNAEAKPSLNKNYPITFPLVENGIFRGYVMRTFDKEIEEQRKYLYNKGFRRRDCLPGNYGKRGGRERKDTVVLVEGWLDKIKAEQIGIKDVASILGWKLSRKQITNLKRSGIKNLICATDNDEAGEKGYRYMLQIQEAFGFNVFRLNYPKGTKDMGDIKQGSEQAKEVIDQIKKFYKKAIYKKQKM